MSLSPSVSIALPVRNGCRTLPAALDSLLLQTEPDIEIVVVDHGSTDETPRILNRYARRDDRVRVESCGGSFVEAANLAWQLGRAPLVARMDADDIAAPERIATQRRFLDEHRHHAGCASRVRIRKRLPDGRTAPPDGGYRRYESWVNSVVSPEEIAASRFIDSPLPNPSTLVRRTELEFFGGYADPEWAEDYDLWLRMLEAGRKMGKSEEVLLDWFDAADRSTRTLARYEWRRFQAAKAHYLGRLPRVRERGIVLAGAGPTGKEFAGLLLDAGEVEIHAFLEVNERQIGNRIRGVPVLASEAMRDFVGDAVLLGAAGRPAPRERIRGLALDLGFEEGDDFFSIG